MHRIDSNGAVDGAFQEGDPASGQKATQLDADWFNAVQEALCILIERAGIELLKGDNDQLYDAVVALVAGVVGDGGGAVATTRQIITAGLASGGGDLTSDRTITVPKATSAQVLAGTDDATAITPLALAGAAASGLSSNGYCKLPGGLILQWGGLTGSYGQGAVAVTFPTTFPNACFRAIPVANNQSSSNSQDIFTQRVSFSQSGATFYFQISSGASGIATGLDYIALGW